jgi:hypothetical protein
MFDVDAGGVSYRESEHEQPGAEVVTAPSPSTPYWPLVVEPMVFGRLSISCSEASAAPSSCVANVPAFVTAWAATVIAGSYYLQGDSLAISATISFGTYVPKSVVI